VTENNRTIRAAFDIFNSVGVIGDVVAWRKQPRPLAARLVSAATGEERRLSTLFDSHTAASLANLLTLVSALRVSINKSDAVLLKTIGKLRTVHDAIDRHDGALASLRYDLETVASELNDELQGVWQRIEVLEAQQGVDRWIAWLESRSAEADFSLADIRVVMDELWWSSFGALMRRAGRADHAVLKVREYLRLEFRRVLADRRALRGTIVVAPLLEAVPHLSDSEREELDLVALDTNWVSRPLTRAVVMRSGGAPDSDAEARSVPVVTTVDRLGERLIDESARATAD